MATIEPKHDLSRPGAARATAAIAAPLNTSPTVSASIDLRSFPDSSATDRREGDWKLTGLWSSQAPFEGEDHWRLPCRGRGVGSYWTASRFSGSVVLRELQVAYPDGR